MKRLLIGLAILSLIILIPVLTYNEKIVTINYVETEYIVYIVANYPDEDSSWEEGASDTCYVYTINNLVTESNVLKENTFAKKCDIPKNTYGEITDSWSFDNFRTNKEYKLKANLNNGEVIEISEEIYEDYANSGYDITREYIANKFF